MTLASYTELKTAIKSWLARSSLPTGTEDEFIVLAEAEFNRIMRNKELRDASTITTTANSPAITLPAAAKLVINISHTDGLKPALLTKMSPGALANLLGDQSPSRPLYWAEDTGAQGARVFPYADDEYTLRVLYWKNITTMVGAASPNWLLTAHPDMYLYGCLRAACLRFVDEKRLVMIDNNFYNKALASFLDQMEEEKIAQAGSSQITIVGGIA